MPRGVYVRTEVWCHYCNAIFLAITKKVIQPQTYFGFGDKRNTSGVIVKP